MPESKAERVAPAPRVIKVNPGEHMVVMRRPDPKEVKKALQEISARMKRWGEKRPACGVETARQALLAARERG